MPWLDENGLLPGRGAPGRPTGRGAGLGAFGVPFGVAGAGADAAAAGASGSAAGSGVGVGSATGCSTTGAGASTTGSGAGSGAAFGPGLGPGLAALFLAAGWSVFSVLPLLPLLSAAGWAGAAALRDSPTSLRKRISAGSSTVELADLTNSPISLNFSRTNLLSTPNSLASSCTRVLATILLRGPTRCPTWWRCGDRASVVVLQTHREVLIESS